MTNDRQMTARMEPLRANVVRTNVFRTNVLWTNAVRAGRRLCSLSVLHIHAQIFRGALADADRPYALTLRDDDVGAIAWRHRDLT